ncbi:amidohydrolase family protein [Asticcacaulis endophyticus]|uniref:Amidohydrolase-related domain-containing protein n=1 Tax=Asticcacaulis endophyticus TaxID=1395890 RepID=A0A918QEW5_9CAUL|nr:amidohydrolase family protein [Asticcacaulis endophyticus]GGZ43466.1 hypothetical protein GCM10011273_32870 [Asticcacaulis endophyticus]
MTRRLIRSALLTTVFGLGFATAALADASFVIIQNGENVGHVEVVETAADKGKTLNIDYVVDDNGRGPKHKQTITLNDKGLPVAGTVAGTSLMGGAVNETFAIKGTTFTWSSQADSGKMALKAPKIYIVNDSNPYDLAIYARYLLTQPNQTAETLPGGSARLQAIKTLDVGQGDQAIAVTIYRLDGLDLAPAYILLDEQNELFAAGNMVRKGYEAEIKALGKLNSELEAERQKTLQAELGHRFDGPVRIKNVRVLDPKTGRLSALSSVVVNGDTIATILPEAEAATNAPKDETIIDGEGGTLVPGLHDMHSHTTRSSGLFLLASGVTSVRDMGNDNGFLDTQIRLMNEGTVAGPRIVRNGFIEGKSPYSANHGFVVSSLDEAMKAVRWYADHGYYQLKIYNSFNPDWIPAVAAESHRLGMDVVGHIPAFYSPDRGMKDGYDEITHINQLVLGWLLKDGEDTRTPLRLTALARAATLDLNSAPVQASVATMKAQGMGLDTTAVIVERLMLSRAGKVNPADAWYLKNMPIGYQRYRKRTYVPLKDAAEDASYFTAFDKLVDIMKMLHDNGIQLLPGTDDTLGFSVKRELELYVKAGMTPAEALKVGTYDMEVYLGRDQQLGTIERGKLADFFLVKGDPTQDLSALRETRMVLKGGFVYFPNEIYDALGITPFTTAPTVTKPDSPVAASDHSDHGESDGAHFHY